jgi:hypothetical protein
MRIWGRQTPIQTGNGRLAQRESASFTPRRSLVRSQYRPPSSAAGSDTRDRPVWFSYNTEVQQRVSCPATGPACGGPLGWRPTGPRYRSRAAGLHVDQQRSVTAALAQRKLIHAQHPGRRADRRDGHHPDQADQRHPAHPAAKRPDNRAPARPPSASATACSTAVAAGGRRAYLLVSPLTCSAKVAFGQSGDRQRNRRNSKQLTTSQPPAAVSSSRRSYRPQTRSDTIPQPGQASDPATALAAIWTVSPARDTSSTCTPAKCGNSDLRTPRSHRAHAHRSPVSLMGS